MRDKTLDRALWVGQLGLAASFLAAGGMKTATPMRELRKKFSWTREAPEGLVRFIGASEVAGALGSVLPAATRIAPSLTGVAAASLATVMALATGLHIKRGEPEALPLTIGLGALAAFVAWGRLRKRPIAARPVADDSSSPDENNELDSAGRTVVQHNYQVSVGDHVFLEEGGEEVGAVRKVEHDHLVVYIEAAGDFVVRGPEVKAIHFGKVILEPEKVDPRLLEAARGAHERETL